MKENDVWKPGMHTNWNFQINFWKISGVLYIIVFCAVAVIGDLILRGVSGQGFFVDGWSSIWMIIVLVIMGVFGCRMGWVLWDHRDKDSDKFLVIVVAIIAVIITSLFIFDVSYITGKFVSMDDNKILSCETNSHWINPFEVTEIRRFDNNVTVSGSTNGNNVTVSVPISANSFTLYRNFGTQDSLTAYIIRTVKNDTKGMFRFQFE